MEQRNPLDLTLIRFRKNEPEPDKTEPGWEAFVESIREEGVRQPLDVTKDGQVIHGRRRWFAARILKLDRVPIIVRDEADAFVIHMEALILREHLTKEAAFYKFIPCLDEFMKSVNDRRLKNLKKGPIFPMSRTATSETHQLLQMRLGLKKDTYFRVIRVWNLFNNADCQVLKDFYRTANAICPGADQLRRLQAEFKAELEPKFISGEKSAWNVLSFAGGALPEIQDKKQSPEQLQFAFWKSPFESLRKATPAWKKLPAETREAALNDWRDTVATMPPDLREHMMEILAEKTK